MAGPCISELTALLFSPSETRRHGLSLRGCVLPSQVQSPDPPAERGEGVAGPGWGPVHRPLSPGSSDLRALLTSVFSAAGNFTAGYGGVSVMSPWSKRHGVQGGPQGPLSLRCVLAQPDSWARTSSCLGMGLWPLVPGHAAGSGRRCMSVVTTAGKPLFKWTHDESVSLELFPGFYMLP